MSFPKLTQSRLVAIQIHGQSELDWVGFFFFFFFFWGGGGEMLVFKVATLCVWGWGQSGGDGGLYGGHWVCGGVCWGGDGVVSG